jgi:hypothetical protein
MSVRCLPSALLKSEEERRDTSSDRGPRAGAPLLFLFDESIPCDLLPHDSADFILVELNRNFAAVPEKRGR